MRTSSNLKFNWFETQLFLFAYSENFFKQVKLPSLSLNKMATEKLHEGSLGGIKRKAKLQSEQLVAPACPRSRAYGGFVSDT